MVTYPVHKTILYGEGLQGIIAMSATIQEKDTGQRASLIRGVINAQWESSVTANDTDAAISLINLSLGEEAITSFRASLENSLDYEHKWLSSNLSSVLHFLQAGTSPTPTSPLKPGLQNLISAILSNAETSISNAEIQSRSLASASTIPQTTRADLTNALKIWAESSHNSLRTFLALAVSSKNWRKLAWWKLLWRVDDVTMITTDILQRSWLVNAEKHILWIGGRIRQAGLLDTATSMDHTAPEARPVHKLGDRPPRLRISEMLPAQNGEADIEGFQSTLAAELDLSTPDPSHIAQARTSLQQSIPPLQARAQTLLLQSVSTTVLTSSLSALLYVSVSTTSVYEAGAIAAVGFVWSLRRLQREWERMRKGWMEMVAEEGARVLRGVEWGWRRSPYSAFPRTI